MLGEFLITLGGAWFTCLLIGAAGASVLDWLLERRVKNESGRSFRSDV